MNNNYLVNTRYRTEKCQEQNKLLFLVFIDLTKAFVLLSRSGLFQLLEEIGSPPKLHSLIVSFNTDMLSTMSYNGAISDPFPIINGVKQDCVLAPTLFGIFFWMLDASAVTSKLVKRVWSNNNLTVSTKMPGSCSHFSTRAKLGHHIPLRRGA